MQWNHLVVLTMCGTQPEQFCCRFVWMQWCAAFVQSVMVGGGVGMAETCAFWQVNTLCTTIFVENGDGQLTVRVGDAAIEIQPECKLFWMFLGKGMCQTTGLVWPHLQQWRLSGDPETAGPCIAVTTHCESQQHPQFEWFSHMHR